MGKRSIPEAIAKEHISTLEQCLREGYLLGGEPSALVEGAKRCGVRYSTFVARIARFKEEFGLEAQLPEVPHVEVSPEGDAPPAVVEGLSGKVKVELLKRPMRLSELAAKTHADIGQVLDALDELGKMGVRVHRISDRYDIPKQVPAAYLSQHKLELVTDSNGQHLVGVLGDNHCGSKYERRDVLADLYDWYEAQGVTTVLHAGNWIDGDAPFNRHDLLAHGLEAQCTMLAETYPQRKGITTYAVWGDDHEGWYAQKEGIDVGGYCEGIFRRMGREDWVNVGFMEAYVPLIHAPTKKQSMLSLVHPGGGSAYAISYSVQKIIESLEGGEKPAVGIYGHYHKMMSVSIRNVWAIQSGCCQDQTPFMRKKRLEAHVGGMTLRLHQDESGAIAGCDAMQRRYFARNFYDARWNRSGPVNLVERKL